MASLEKSGGRSRQKYDLQHGSLQGGKLLFIALLCFSGFDKPLSGLQIRTLQAEVRNEKLATFPIEDHRMTRA